MLTALVQFFTTPSERPVEVTTEDIKEVLRTNAVLLASVRAARESLALAYGIGGEAPGPRYEALRQRQEASTGTTFVKFFTD